MAQNFDSEESLFAASLDLFDSLATTGNFAEAEAVWQQLDPMGRRWSRATYVSGDAESRYAQFRFWRGDLTKIILQDAERLVREGNSRQSIREIHSQYGEWRLGQDEPIFATESFHEAVRLARESGMVDDALCAETWLALVSIRAGMIGRDEAQREIERLASDRRLPDYAYRPLAMLWLELGGAADDEAGRKAAQHHARTAYKYAWADGEPYVRRYELDQTCKILDQLGEPHPELSPYDPEKDIKFDWEDDVGAAIEKLKAEREEAEDAESET